MPAINTVQSFSVALRLVPPPQLAAAESVSDARPLELATAVTPPARSRGVAQVKAFAYPVPDVVDGRLT